MLASEHFHEARLSAQIEALGLPVESADKGKPDKDKPNKDKPDKDTPDKDKPNRFFSSFPKKEEKHPMNLVPKQDDGICKSAISMQPCPLKAPYGATRLYRRIFDHFRHSY